jgi:phosphatidylserine decarboxylase
LGAILTGLYDTFVFKRLPARRIPGDNTRFISPADGEIVGVRKYTVEGNQPIVEPKGIDGAIRTLVSDIGQSGYIVSIKLNITDVHYQRAPVGSVVISTQYTPGDFNNAIITDNEEQFFRHENEKNEITLQSVSGLYKYKIIQIAGFLARQIDCYVKPGQEVAQGDVIGLIKLGSQVTVILPGNVDILVKKGDKVVDGETTIASI